MPAFILHILLAKSLTLFVEVTTSYARSDYLHSVKQVWCVGDERGGEKDDIGWGRDESNSIPVFYIYLHSSFIYSHPE